ncbi:hypothetical protein [Spirochaeta cellobiosiphila]|uniref:hypothetical protein n=1 Tax=Spirochaeta cellobiosiphila TaxID=504483 RepID=UPI00040A37F1|nr:hypothetical protein [Spirochaeta cellobiosiphila]
MYQIYFLSIVLNVFAGGILAKESLDEKLPSLARFVELMSSTGVKGFMGLVTAIIGIVNLLTYTEGAYPIVGDLIPALAGMASGVTLMLEYYKEKATTTSDVVDKLDHSVLANKNIIGIATILTGILHFLLPGLLLI